MRDNIVGGALTESTFLVLLAVHTPTHGYGVMQFIERETGGRVSLGAGTLYGALQTLSKKGWIAPVGDGPDVGRKEYLITDLGRDVAARELRRLGELRGLAERILGRNRT